MHDIVSHPKFPFISFFFLQGFENAFLLNENESVDAGNFSSVCPTSTCSQSSSEESQLTYTFAAWISLKTFLNDSVEDCTPIYGPVEVGY